MRLEPVKIKSNDYDTPEKKLIEQMGGLLNPFFDKIVFGFNKNLTVEENLPFEFITFDVTVDSSGVPIGNNSILTSLKNFKGFVCVSATNLTGNGIYPTSSPFLLFTVRDNFYVDINKVLGLPSTASYRLVLMGIS